jgi:hypothetical protein
LLPAKANPKLKPLLPTQRLLPLLTQHLLLLIQPLLLLIQPLPVLLPLLTA